MGSAFAASQPARPARCHGRMRSGPGRPQTRVAVGRIPRPGRLQFARRRARRNATTPPLYLCSPTGRLLGSVRARRRALCVEILDPRDTSQRSSFRPARPRRAGTAMRSSGPFSAQRHSGRYTRALSSLGKRVGNLDAGWRQAASFSTPNELRPGPAGRDSRARLQLELVTTNDNSREK
jgi:hypothetical protein